MNELRDFFEFPWEGVLSALGIVVLVATQFPRVRPVAQHVIQNVLGVNDAITNGVNQAVAQASHIVEARVEERHVETTSQIEGVKQDVDGLKIELHSGFEKINGRIEDAVRAGDVTRNRLEEHLDNPEDDV